MIGNKRAIFKASVTRTFTTGVDALLDVKLLDVKLASQLQL